MLEMRQIAAFSGQAGRHPMQEPATAPVGASLSRELFNQAAKSSRASSLLQGLCCAEMRQIADFTVQAGRHPMQEAATASVGASLSRELFSKTAKSSRDKLAPTRFVQCRKAADRRLHRPGRKAPHAGGCNRTCRSELVSRAFQQNRKELARQARSYRGCAVQKCGRLQTSPSRPAGTPCRR